MNIWRQQLRHLDCALETETVPLFERKDDGEIAVNELAGIALCLLEMGMEMLSAVPSSTALSLTRPCSMP